MKKTEEQMGKCPTCGSLIKIIKRRAVPKETYVPDEPEAAENARLREQFAKAEAKAAQIKNYYCIPKWCRMPPAGHFDGIGGCWSISSGIVLAKGEKACERCEYHG